MNPAPITAERLRYLVKYDPDTGIFTWRASRRRCRVGDVCGCKAKHGYWFVRLDDVLYTGHRLAWLYIHGVWPKNQIDHIDGDRLNNRTSNLREATNAENAQNVRGARSSSKSGVLGVRKENSKWLAEIKLGGVGKRIGLFNTPEEAHEAYLREKRAAHTHNTL
jgi:hypothetical protein